jgi:alpha-mannosidase
VAAAEAACQGDVETARRELRAAFDRLHEAREYFYPTAARLVDVTLVAPTTLDEGLRTELSGVSPRNFLVAGEVVEQIAEREPATLGLFRQALTDGRAGLIGGEHVEAPLPMLDPEAIIFQIQQGLATYEKHLGRRPKIFGRRRFGLTPVLPGILRREGFLGAFHCTLDDGQFPTRNQSRIQWEGFDGATIEAVGSIPLDASRAETFLGLSETLSHAMTLDNGSTVLFAHWPGRACCWYEDLRRVAAYGSVLGTFVTIEDFFEETASVAQSIRHTPDSYRSPYLAQDVAAGQRNPISRWVRYYHRRRWVEDLAALDLLAACSGGRTTEPVKTYEQWASAIEESLASAADDPDVLDEELSNQRQKSLFDFAATLDGDPSTVESGTLAISPHGFSQPFFVPQASFLVPPTCPAMGFSWYGSRDEEPAVIEKRGWFGRKTTIAPPMAEEGVLRNEFFEVRFDLPTGAIRAVSDYQGRDPRVAQQIALRLARGGDPGSDENYSIMAADEWRISSPGPTLGEMVCRGRLLDREGRRVAGFQQTTRVWRGSRIIEIEIALDVERQPEANPWESYYAVRFAWKDEASALYRSVNMAETPTELKQFESPYFVDIRRAKQRTTLLTGGLPYHRKCGLRKLDTLLAVRGETARQYRLGIGIDLPYAMSSGLSFMDPPFVLPNRPAPHLASGWLFHLDCRNVLATHWEIVGIFPSRFAREVGGEGTKTGFRVRLLEVEGRGVLLRLRCCRHVRSARLIRADAEASSELTVEGDRIDVPIGPHQRLELEAIFS